MSLEIRVYIGIWLAAAVLTAGVYFCFKTAFQRRSTYGIVVYVAAALVQLCLALHAFAFGGGTTAVVAAHYGFAIWIGLAVGAMEMVSRYQDDPFAPLVSAPGLFYVTINGAASALAYYLTGPLNVTVAEPLKTFVAGFGAMAFFRSGLFTARIGKTEIPAGPNLVLQVFLRALDRAYDRERSVPRAKFVRPIMRGLSFDAIKAALPSLCFNLMQNVSADEIAGVNAQVVDLAKAEMSNEAKCLSLGLTLINIVGEKTLHSAIVALGGDIRSYVALSRETVMAFATIDPALAEKTLPDVCAQLAQTNHVRAIDGDQNLEPPDFKASVPALPLESRALLMLYKLVAFYGEPSIKVAIRILSQAPPDAGDAPNPAPAAPVAAPPPSSPSP
ncbi:hypothetical protein [Caulobacter hibisci]|uniref:Uncharacterized protein n=1 Tax=Caulobacter hibisci TaxID=2035993 RepID=A0ABS0T2M6_9CAUL|nr:hypothetical protein [Caulobacter hibisci]MBI1685986.1 hypothetical protein [Caulobacter hibisci]